MATPERDRPDPDALLAQLQQQEAQAQRGKLRIYFGASAGVGKTYAMLAAARKLKEEGRDVLVGVVETHGRSETAALLEGLPMLPPKELEYKGNRLNEFDLDAAIARHPDLILVDELAHTNAPGSRHPKRWQDVEELLAQRHRRLHHAQRPAPRESERCRGRHHRHPRLGDAARHLLRPGRRSDAGRHPGRRAARTAQSRQGLSRRAGGARLEEFFPQRQSDRAARAGAAPHRRPRRGRRPVLPRQAGDRARLEDAKPRSCAASARARRGARGAQRRRLATQLNVDWTAVYVETPALQRLPSGASASASSRSSSWRRIWARRPRSFPAATRRSAVIDYARSHNISKIIFGRSRARRCFRLADLVRDASGIAGSRARFHRGRPRGRASRTGSRSSCSDAVARRRRMRRPAQRLLRYVWAAAACALPTLIGTLLQPYFDPANIVMLFLLTVVVVAVMFGRGPAVLATLLGVASFDFFFVPPRFSFAVSDVQYLLTFVVMLAVGLITGQLTAGLRYQARVAAHREERVARAVRVRARSVEPAAGRGRRRDHGRFHRPHLPRQGRAAAIPTPTTALVVRAACLACASASIWAPRSGRSTAASPPAPAPIRCRGTSSCICRCRRRCARAACSRSAPDSRRLLLVPEQRRQLDTFAALAAIALERVHYVDVAQQALIKMESERLRNSLLSALSHDLRTPLAALFGLADSLKLTKPPLSGASAGIADAIREAARGMSALVNNLLDMARIQSGEVKLNLQWQPLEEVVGSALKSTQTTARYTTASRSTSTASCRWSSSMPC